MLPGKVVEMVCDAPAASALFIGTTCLVFQSVCEEFRLVRKTLLKPVPVLAPPMFLMVPESGIGEPSVVVMFGADPAVRSGRGFVTVTVAFAVAAPPGPVHVRVYVVVLAGETGVVVPPLVGVTVPRVGLMDAVVEFVQDQFNVDDWPVVIFGVFAVKDACGGGCGFTTTVAVALAEPPAPVHVIVYVYVFAVLRAPVERGPPWVVPPVLKSALVHDVAF